MKIGLLLLDSNPWDTVDAAIKNGFSSVEIVLDNYLDALKLEDIKLLKKLCIKNGVRFAVHAPSVDIKLGSLNSGIRRESLNQLLTTISLVGNYAEYMTIHTGFIPKFKKKGSLEQVINGLKTLVCEAEKDNIEICIENIHENSINELLDYSLLIEPRKIQYTIDIAHIVLYSNFDPIVGLEILYDNVRNIHVSDNDGVNDLHLTLGSGIINYENIINYLVAKCYSNTITIEAINLESAIRSKEYIQNKINMTKNYKCN
ncbi:sugar phosphate isomerase/epimerase family protein [Marinifilum flexuosum]|uniref:Sugar phosphate isomerase/epimerase n=1 Tax=Marinifilum flexuosum TaxID=1117708 RepID=A0A419X412_9BACT|nr:sugar phosphate isomerase/epimerase family protein [Marinifilum flexuosum]RKE02448.1 sugar phosphate isomerase/epimerase [Marinifilum flexuosum]